MPRAMTWSREELTNPPVAGYAVTASDTVDDPNGPFRALSCTAAGLVRAIMVGEPGNPDAEVTFHMAAGVQFGGIFKRVFVATTNATGIVGWR